jgi:hypothetical protein
LIKLFLKMLKFSPKKFFYSFIEEQNFVKENEESIWIFRNIQNFQHEIFKFNWWTWVWSRPCTIVFGILTPPWPPWNPQNLFKLFLNITYMPLLRLIILFL